MRKNYYLASCVMLSLVLLLFTACSGGSSASGGAAIPPNAFLVGNVNMAQLLEKAGPYADTLMSEIDDEEMEQLLAAANEKAVFFMTQNQVFGVDLSFNEAISKELFITNEAAWVKMNLTTPVEGYEIFTQNDRLIALAAQKVVVLEAIDPTDDAAGLAPQARWEKLVGAPLHELLSGKCKPAVFEKNEIDKLSTQHDVCAIVNASDSAFYEMVFSQAKNYYRTLGVPNGYENLTIPTTTTEPSTVFLSFNFKNGEMAFDCELLRISKEQQELLDINKGISGDLNDYIPESSQLYYAMGTAVFATVFEKYGESSGLTEEQNKMVLEVLNSLNGDFVLAGDFNLLIPNLVIAAEVKDTKIMDLIKAEIPLGEPVEGYENVYAMTESGITFYFGIENNTLFATNIEAAYQAIVTGEKLDKNISALPFVKRTKGDPQAFLLLLDEIIEKNPYSAQFNAKQYPMVDQLKSVEFEALSKKEMSFRILLKEDGMNSLELILQEVASEL